MKPLISALAVAAIVAAARADATEPYVVKADADRLGENTVLFGNSPNRIKVTASDTDGRMALFEYIGHQRGGPPLHVHPLQDEIFFIREGDYLFQVGNERHHLSAGDTIFLPRAVPHTFAQLSADGRMVFMFTPAGDMEAFFREQATMSGPPQPADAAAMFSAHGMQVVGPPLPLE